MSHKWENWPFWCLWGGDSGVANEGKFDDEPKFIPGVSAPWQ